MASYVAVFFLSILVGTFSAHAQLAPPLYQYEQSAGTHRTQHLDACSTERRAVSGSEDLNGIFRLASCLLATVAAEKDQRQKLAAGWVNGAEDDTSTFSRETELQQEAQQLMLHVVSVRPDLFEAHFAVGLSFIDTHPLLAHRVLQLAFVPVTGSSEASSSSVRSTTKSPTSTPAMSDGLPPARRAQLESVAATAALKTGHTKLAVAHTAAALGIQPRIYATPEESDEDRRSEAAPPPSMAQQFSHAFFAGSALFDAAVLANPSLAEWDKRLGGDVGGGNFPQEEEAAAAAAAPASDHTNSATMLSGEVGLSGDFESSSLVVSAETLTSHDTSLRRAASNLGPQRVAELLLGLAHAYYLDFERLIGRASISSAAAARPAVKPTELLRRSFRIVSDSCRIKGTYACRRFESMLWMAARGAGGAATAGSLAASQEETAQRKAVQADAGAHRRLEDVAWTFDSRMASLIANAATTATGTHAGSDSRPGHSGVNDFASQSVRRNITVLHAARPLVVAVEHFLSDAEADELLKWHRIRLNAVRHRHLHIRNLSKSERERGQRPHRGFVCFAPASELLHTLVPPSASMSAIGRASRLLAPGSNGRVCVSRGTSGNEDNLVQLLRTSGLSADEAAYVLPADSERVDELVDRRAQEIFGLDPAFGLPAQFLSYGGATVPSDSGDRAAGNEEGASDNADAAAGYHAHADCALLQGQAVDRMTTMLVYLNDVPEGSGGRTFFPATLNASSSLTVNNGTTAFPHVAVTPRKGLAVVFRSDAGPFKIDGEDFGEYEEDDDGDGDGDDDDDDDDEYEEEPDGGVRAGFCDPSSVHVAEALRAREDDATAAAEKHVIQRWYSRQRLPWTGNADPRAARKDVVSHLARKWPAEVLAAMQEAIDGSTRARSMPTTMMPQELGVAAPVPSSSFGGVPVIFCDASQSCREYV